MTSLRAALDDYLRIRRRLGFAMPQDGRLLEGFVEFLQRAGAERITAELALEWARMPVAADPSRWGQRLGVARGFARHLATIDPTSEVPSKDLLPGHRSRIAPYIYSEAEIAALMAAARALRPRLRAARHETLIGPLAVTGMRPGEALGLDRQDVDLGHGAVFIRAGKQKKQREVPLHESTISALGRYARQRDAGLPTPSTPAFFISARGRRMGRAELNQTFTKLIAQVGLEGRGARARPRPHDLRHILSALCACSDSPGKRTYRPLPPPSSLLVAAFQAPREPSAHALALTGTKCNTNTTAHSKCGKKTHTCRAHAD